MKVVLQSGGRGSVPYEGAQTVKALHDFALEHLPSEVVNLSESALPDAYPLSPAHADFAGRNFYATQGVQGGDFEQSVSSTLLGSSRQ